MTPDLRDAKPEQYAGGDTEYRDFGDLLLIDWAGGVLGRHTNFRWLAWDGLDEWYERHGMAPL